MHTDLFFCVLPYNVLLVGRNALRLLRVFWSIGGAWPRWLDYSVACNSEPIETPEPRSCMSVLPSSDSVTVINITDS
jgi:hypothetical protein